MSDFRVGLECEGGTLPPHFYTLLFSSRSHTRHKTRSSIVYSPLHSFLDGMDPVCADFGWTGIHTGAGATAALWRRSADINNDGGPKAMLCLKWPMERGLQQNIIVNGTHWKEHRGIKSVLKVFVCIVSTQAHLVQSVHCVHRGCGLPHVLQCLLFQQRSGIFPAAASLTQSSLHFCLGNVPWPVQTDVEKSNSGRAMAPPLSQGILKSDWPTEVNYQQERKTLVSTYLAQK